MLNSHFHDTFCGANIYRPCDNRLPQNTINMRNGPWDIVSIRYNVLINAKHVVRPIASVSSLEIDKSAYVSCNYSTSRARPVYI